MSYCLIVYSYICFLCFQVDKHFSLPRPQILMTLRGEKKLSKTEVLEMIQAGMDVVVEVINYKFERLNNVSFMAALKLIWLYSVENK